MRTGDSSEALAWAGADEGADVARLMSWVGLSGQRDNAERPTGPPCQGAEWLTLRTDKKDKGRLTL